MTHTDKVKQLKRNILQAAYRAKEGHIASAYSVLDILYVLYEDFLHHNSMCPGDPKRDFLFLSKGHASLALYAVLADCGYFSMDWLNTMCQAGSHLGGHPHRLCVPGVEASTGSLGHGLPMAVGTAMALQHEKADNRVICIVGDGELNEGSNWEALMLAAQHWLKNLLVIVDYNRSNDRALNLQPLEDKFNAFGWETYNGISGHDHSAISATVNHVFHEPRRTLGPSLIIAHTVKGCGIKAMESEPHAWHHRTPTDEEYEQFKAELS